MTDTSVRNRLSAILGSAMARFERLVVILGKLAVAFGWAAFWLMVARLHLLTQDWVGVIATVIVASIPILLLGRSYLSAAALKAHVIGPARDSIGGQGRASNE